MQLKVPTTMPSALPTKQSGVATERAPAPHHSQSQDHKPLTPPLRPASVRGRSPLPRPPASPPPSWLYGNRSRDVLTESQRKQGATEERLGRKQLASLCFLQACLRRRIPNMFIAQSVPVTSTLQAFLRRKIAQSAYVPPSSSLQAMLRRQNARSSYVPCVTNTGTLQAAIRRSSAAAFHAGRKGAAFTISAALRRGNAESTFLRLRISRLEDELSALREQERVIAEQAAKARRSQGTSVLQGYVRRIGCVEIWRRSRRSARVLEAAHRRIVDQQVHAERRRAARTLAAAVGASLARRRYDSGEMAHDGVGIVSM